MISKAPSGSLTLDPHIFLAEVNWELSAAAHQLQIIHCRRPPIKLVAVKSDIWAAQLLAGQQK